MNPIKKITHYLAVLVAAVGGFMLTPAGQALLAQYPHIAAVLGAVSTIFALYHSPKAVKLIIAALLLSALTANAQSTQKKSTHALVMVAKVAVAPVTKPVSTLKKTLGGVLFAVESGVDVVHGGASIADKAFDAIGVAGKVPVVDAAYAVVSIVNTDSGKLDAWLERQEQFLFGTHN